MRRLMSKVPNGFMCLVRMTVQTVVQCRLRSIKKAVKRFEWRATRHILLRKVFCAVRSIVTWNMFITIDVSCIRTGALDRRGQVLGGSGLLGMKP